MNDDTSKKASRFRDVILLPLLLLAGAALGFLFGGLAGPYWSEPTWAFPAGLTALLGEIFLNILKLVVVPLIFCSMVAGVAALGGARRIGGIAGYTFAYYMLTTFAAVVVGLILVNLIQPGVDVEAGAFGADLTRADQPWFAALFDVFRGMFPPNLFQAAADGNILGLLIFALAFGGLLTSLGERGRQVVAIFETINDALLKLVRLIIWAAPVGVLCLVADRIGEAGGGAAVGEEISRLGQYFATVLAGLFVHGVIILPLLLFLLARRNPLRFFGFFAEAVLTAFSTASSAATLPVTMRSARSLAGISHRASGFVLPLGATINMDGTALYEAVAAIFIAQVYGIDLSFGQQVVVCLTATLAAVGAAAIPQAGLVTMVLVLTAAKIPTEGIALLLSIDWLLDRFRTAVNVWGDSVGAAVVDRRWVSGDDAAPAPDPGES